MGAVGSTVIGIEIDWGELSDRLPIDRDRLGELRTWCFYRSRSIGGVSLPGALSDRLGRGLGVCVLSSASGRVGSAGRILKSWGSLGERTSGAGAGAGAGGGVGTRAGLRLGSEGNAAAARSSSRSSRQTRAHADSDQAVASAAGDVVEGDPAVHQWCARTRRARHASRHLLPPIRRDSQKGRRLRTGSRRGGTTRPHRRPSGHHRLRRWRRRRQGGTPGRRGDRGARWSCCARRAPIRDRCRAWRPGRLWPRARRSTPASSQ